MARKTMPIPFGAGLDRLSGSGVVDPGSQVDLRNVYLARGRMELRRGLASQAVPWGTDVIGVAAVKKTGLSAVVIYDSVSKDVRLYTFDGAVTFSLVGTLWTINAAVTGHVPRVAIAEVYSKVFIAHEEPLFLYRGNTKVFDVTASTVGDFSLTLDSTPGATPTAVKFRGVAKHLAYLIGWGYGTATDPDRPETLRISQPGDPMTFDPQYYFLVGSPSDPIIAGTPLVRDDPGAGGFAIGKDSEWWRLTGYDWTTFGVVPMDPDFGVITSRAWTDVNGELFFWSLQGPRSTTGGPSVDLTPPLDLPGPLPDATAATNDRLFAWYDPTELEVCFCMGTWTYVLHLKDAPRRWSYRPYGIELNSAGFLFPATGTGKLNPIAATIGTVSTTAPSYGPGADLPTFTVPWTLVGTPTGTEIVEVWARHALILTKSGIAIDGFRGSWGTKPIVTAAASAGTVTFAVPYYLTSYDLAIRIVSGGTPGAGYTSSPDTWPATATATHVSAGAITSFVTTGLWERRSAVEHGQPFAYVGPGVTDIGAVTPAHPELTYKYEQSADAGATWQQHASGTYTTPLKGSVHANADKVPPPGSGLPVPAFRYRLTVIGPSASVGPTATSSDIVLGPGAPTISSISADTGALQLNFHEHHIFVLAGTHGGPIEVHARHDPDGSYSPTYVVPSGDVDAVFALDNTGGLDHIRAEAWTHLSSSSSLPPGAAAGATSLGLGSVDDYSVVTVATASY